MNTRGLGRGNHVLLGRCVAPIGDVVADRIVEQDRILRHDANRPMQALLRYVAHILSINGNRAATDVIEPEQEPRDGRFPRPRRPHNGHVMPRRHIKANPAQDWARLVIPKRHPVKPDRPARNLQRGRGGLVLDLGGLFQKVEHLAHIHKTLTNFAIDRPKKVQRNGDLHHIGVDHDKIAHGQITILHPDRRHDHNRDKAARNKERLAEIEERQ